MSLEVFTELEQGTDEWLAARCGIVTASVVGQMVTSRQPSAIETDCPDCGSSATEPCTGKRSPGPLKTLHPARAAAARELDKVITADNASDTARGLVATLAAERITGHVEPIQANSAMERGTLDEPYAREIYSEHYAEAVEVGFMVRTEGGIRLGYSPDGLVGDDGLIEIKSRNQKIQLRTILADEVPLENMAQIQCGLLVSGRDWCDYVSYCGGMPLYVRRVFRDIRWFVAINDAAKAFEADAAQMVEKYELHTLDMPKTVRIDHYAEMRF